MTEALVRFEAVDLGYGTRRVLRGLSFAIESGDYVGLVGPNGSGKTTILRAILGLVPPSAGNVTIRPGPGHATLRVGYVPQREAVNTLIPFTALDVVKMVATAQRTRFGWGNAVDREKARAALTDVGMGAYAERSYRDLSGGQRQRVLLARALAMDPDILLLDEPTSGLDLGSEVSLLELIRRLRSARRITVLYVTHYLQQIASEADHVLLLQEGTALFGSTPDVLTDRRLSDLYAMPVRVTSVDGHRVVLAGVAAAGSPDEVAGSPREAGVTALAATPAPGRSLPAGAGAGAKPATSPTKAHAAGRRRRKGRRRR